MLGFSLFSGETAVAGSRRRRRGLASVLALAVGVGLLAEVGSAAPVLAASSAAQVSAVTPASGMLNAVLPERILDTRTTTGGHHGKLGRRDHDVAGAGRGWHAERRRLGGAGQRDGGGRDLAAAAT